MKPLLAIFLVSLSLCLAVLGEEAPPESNWDPESEKAFGIEGAAEAMIARAEEFRAVVEVKILAWEQRVHELRKSDARAYELFVRILLLGDERERLEGEIRFRAGPAIDYESKQALVDSALLRLPEMPENLEGVPKEILVLMRETRVAFLASHERSRVLENLQSFGAGKEGLAYLYTMVENRSEREGLDKELRAFMLHKLGGGFQNVRSKQPVNGK